MERLRKVRNFRSEHRYAFIADAAAVFLVLLIANIFLPESGPIGRRSMSTLYAADGILSLAFMNVLEKYAVNSDDMYEQTVIVSLSEIYTFALMSGFNFVFFGSVEKLKVDAFLGIGKIAVLLGTDFLLMKIFKNPKYYQKPKLLIIYSRQDNFTRTKRIKYGVTDKYDSWYENVGGMSDEEFFDFANEKFPMYDAICILDGLKDIRYAEAVSVAMRENLELYIVPKLIDVGKTNARFVRMDDVLTLYMPKASLSGAELFVKRIIDIVLGCVGLAVAAIPMAIIACTIKLTSEGPVFYKQVRLTKDKKEFYIYKFRTMIPDAEKLSGPMFSEKNDPRITKVGKILRACRMDELPQIINILKGDMSIVGPRPERPMFVEAFEEEIENYDYRFAVKAGLTSLSHVYGRYSTYIHDRTYYDLFYITHYSLLLDFKIMLLTSKTIFLKNAAEGEDEFKEKTVDKTKGEMRAD